MINTPGKQYSRGEHDKFMDTESTGQRKPTIQPMTFFFSNIVTLNKNIVHFTDLC